MPDKKIPPSNSDIFKRRLAHFVEIEKRGAFTRPNAETGELQVLGIKAQITRNEVVWEPFSSMALPPFGELSLRLTTYDQFERILHGGRRSTAEGRRQTHCLDCFKSSEFTIDKLLWDCAEAIRFEQNYTVHLREIENILGLQQREPRKIPNASITRARDMQRLAASVNSGILTGTALLQPLDGRMDAIPATLQARKNAVARKFGCIQFPQNIQPRQIKGKTPALLAFNLRWIFQRWPLSQEIFHPKRNTQLPPLSPPCYDLIADFVSAIFPDFPQDTISVKNSLLKSIHPKSQYCGW